MTPDKKKPKKHKNPLIAADVAVFDFYRAFGIEYEPEEQALTGQYYGFLGLKEFFVRFGHKGRRFTRVFARSIEEAKANLTELQKKTLSLIIKVN